MHGCPVYCVGVPSASLCHLCGPPGLLHIVEPCTLCMNTHLAFLAKSVPITPGDQFAAGVLSCFSPVTDRSVLVVMLLSCEVILELHA